MKPLIYHAPRTFAFLCARCVSSALLAIALLLSFHPLSDGKVAHAQTTSAKRGWLGIVMAEQAGHKVFIKRVLRGSPAEKAGLLEGDRLLRINDVEMGSAQQVSRVVGGQRPSSSIQVLLSRKDKETSVTIRLEEAPSSEELLRRQHVGQPAPALGGLQTLAGTQGPTLDDYRGKVLVLDFWASYCLACAVTTRSLNQWHERYFSHGLEVVGIAAESSDIVAKAVRRFDMRYPSYADPDMVVSASYPINELPSIVVIDRQGIIRDVATGYDPARMRQMERRILQLISEPIPTEKPNKQPSPPRR